MQELAPVDLARVVSRIPRDVRNLMKDGKLILGGGFIRALIAGENPSDVDLFGPTKEMLREHAQKLTIDRKGRFHETPNAFTVLTPSRMPVQFITRWLYDSPGAVVEEFDFSVCQAVVWWKPSDDPDTVEGSWQSLCSDRFYQDLASRRLWYTAPKRAEDAGGSMLRVRKYLKRGYHIEAPALAGVIARIAMGVSQVDEALDGDEAWLAQTVCGLLREVDPLIAIDGTDLVDEHEIAAELRGED